MNDYYPHSEAQAQAKEVIGLIEDTCERVAIGGGIRRGKEYVHDAEIVLIPKWNYHARLDTLVAKGRLRKAEYVDKNGRMTYRWGGKYRGVTLCDSDMKVELYTAVPDSWGYIFWLRTGPGEANKKLVTTLKFRGPYLADEGFLWLERGEELTPQSKKISVPDEETFFRLLGLPYEQPAERGKHYTRLEWQGHAWGTEHATFVEEIQPRLI